MFIVDVPQFRYRFANDQAVAAYQPAPAEEYNQSTASVHGVLKHFRRRSMTSPTLGGLSWRYVSGKYTRKFIHSPSSVNPTSQRSAAVSTPAARMPSKHRSATSVC